MNEEGCVLIGGEARIDVLGALLSDAALRAPDARFLQLGGATLTHGELEEQATRLGGALQAVGVRKGDRVAIILPNCIEYVVAIFALAKIGAVQVPINTFLRGEFLRHQIGESQASVVIADELGIGQLAPIVATLPDLCAVIAVGPCKKSLPVPIEEYAALMASGAEAKLPKVTAEDLCNILYTSGTTGASKGCMLSHGYYTWIPEAFVRAGWYGEGDAIFGANPLFHASGQIWIVVTALSCRGEAIVEPAFSASTFMRRLRETEATVFNGMGAMIAMLLAQPPSPEDRNHRIRQATCVPTTRETWHAFHDRFGIRLNSEVFGQTEFYPATITPAGEPLTPGGAGKVMPHVELRIVDDLDREVPTGEVGEIVMRPRQPRTMFSGYFNNPAATAQAWRNLWHHTGDYGRLDESGTLYFADRKKDSLRRRGENVSSMELEAAILTHDAVAAVAVHAVPSELGEDEIKACIIPKAEAKVSPEELFSFFKASLPYYAIPRYVEFMDEFPRNSVNRVQKFKLRELGITPETLDFEALGLTVERAERRL